MARDWRMIGSFYPNPATHTNRVHVALALDARWDVDPSLDAGEEGLSTRRLPAVRSWTVWRAVSSGRRCTSPPST